MAKRRFAVALIIPPPVAYEVDGLRKALGDRQLGKIDPHITLIPPINLSDDGLEDTLVLLDRVAATTPSLQVWLGPVTTFGPGSPVRYLAVDTGRWLPGRRLLVPPASVDTALSSQRKIRLALTREELRVAEAAGADVVAWTDEVAEAGLPDGDPVHLPALVRDVFGLSTSEARRLIAQGGVKVDDRVMSDLDVSRSALEGALLQVGKRQFVRLRGVS
jgi:hypothetical protein